MPTTCDLPLDPGTSLRLVQGAAADKPAALAGALAIPEIGSVVVLAGGDLEFDTALQPRLMQLVSRGLLRAVREAGAICVGRAGGGGLARLLGQAVVDAERTLPLLGVAPLAQIAIPGQPRDGDDARLPPAAGLTHVLLTPGAEWGSELRTKLDVAQALAAGKPLLMVVIGGGASTAAEVLQAVRRRWPVLMVRGSGGAADELARQWAAQAADGDDPAVAEVLADGSLTCITLGDKVGEAVETLARQILRQSGGESVLRQAWRRFGAIDAAAVQQQQDFMRSQWWILALGVIAVLLAVGQTALKDVSPDLPNLKGFAEALAPLLGYALIVVPITLSAMIAATNRFKPGKRWVLLRSAAESIKREIYGYRLRASTYTADATREKNLAKAVEDITRRLARTEANTTALPGYAGPIPPMNAASPRDDGMSFLGTDQYVQVRLDDQLSFYRRKTVALEDELRRLQYWLLALGALGTLLAALGGPWVIWIALTTSLASAFMAYLNYRQVEATLTGYNQTATDLDNILSWWTSLQADEQALRDNIEALASHTEEVLSSELAGWTQRMTDALEKLRDSQVPKDDDGHEPAAADEPPAPPAPGTDTTGAAPTR